jgi:hypothetical protein
MIETMFLDIPLAIALGAAAGFATRNLIRLSLRRLLTYAVFVAATLAPALWMLPLLMDRAAAFPVYEATRNVSLALVALSTVWCFETWSPVLRSLFALEQIAMLLRYATWYGLAPQALCTAWDASQQRPTGLGLLIAGLGLGAAFAARVAAQSTVVQAQPLVRAAADSSRSWQSASE